MWSEGITSRKNGYMREEIFATWVATSALVLVLGANFSGRDSVSAATRQIVDTLFICISLLLLIWAGLSFFGFVPFLWHRWFLVGIVLTLASLFTFMLYLSATQQL